MGTVEPMPLSGSRLVAAIESTLREHPDWTWRMALHHVSKRDGIPTVDSQVLQESLAEYERSLSALRAFARKIGVTCP